MTNSSFDYDAIFETDYDDQIYTLTQLIPQIETYLIWPIVSVNFISNLLNIYVYTRKTFRKQSISTYLGLCALFDIIQIYSCVYHYLNIKYKSLYETPRMFNTNTITCKFGLYLYYTLQLYSPWLSVLASADRTIQTIFIKASKLLVRKKFQLAIVSVLIAALSLIYVYLAVLFEYVNLPKVSLTRAGASIGIYTCFMSLYPFNSVKRLNYFLNIILTTFLPFILMTVCNILTIYRLIKSKVKSFGRKRVNIAKERTFAVTLIGMNIMFFLTYLPFGVLGIINELLKFDINVFSQLNMIKIDISINIAFWLRNFYSSLQFFILIFVNKIFRDEIKLVIRRPSSILSLN